MSVDSSEIKIKIEDNKILDQFLNTPFIAQSYNLSDTELYVRLSLGLEAERVTAHYNEGFPVPRTPLFHPYSPNENFSEMNASGIPHTVLTLKCPKETLNFLPDTVKKLLVESNINPNQIEISVITQNMPWTGVPLLIRPHYWVHGDPQLDTALKAGGAFKTDCEVALCTTRPESTLLCDGLQNVFANPSKLLPISTHETVCSPEGMGVLSGILTTHSNSFFTLIKAADGRVALTLHWLLNDEDQRALEEAASKLRSQQVPTLKMLMFYIAQHIPGLMEPLDDLIKLFNTTLHKLHPTPILSSFKMDNTIEDNKDAKKKYLEIADLAQAAIDRVATMVTEYERKNQKLK